MQVTHFDSLRNAEAAATVLAQALHTLLTAATERHGDSRSVNQLADAARDAADALRIYRTA